jgi:hypothetical protein
MAFGFTYKLELADGTPHNPATLRSSVLAWRPADTIPLGAGALRVVDVRDDDADQALVVRDVTTTLREGEAGGRPRRRGRRAYEI